MARVTNVNRRKYGNTWQQVLTTVENRGNMDATHENGLIGVKEYAERCQLTPEAIRKKLRRYSAELEGHISTQNRKQFLDSYAVDFLEAHKEIKPVIVYDWAKDEEIAQLKAEVEELKQKLVMIMQQSIADKEKIADLTGQLLEKEREISGTQTKLIEALSPADPPQEEAKKGFWAKLFG